MTPNTLRVVAFVMLILPIVGVFTGYYRAMGAVAILQAVMYVSGFWCFGRWLGNERRRGFKPAIQGTVAEKSSSLGSKCNHLTA